MRQTNDLRIAHLEPLIPPSVLKEEYPMTERANSTVIEGRRTIESILNREDQRMLAVVGPCSIHDPKAALEYAEKLKKLHERFSSRLFIVMRIYFEKPRTTLGWRGLIVDPCLDGSYNIAHGLRIARDLLLTINGMGLPAASEMLDPIVPQYIADLISWAAIGARTTESQTHRDMASGLSMPVGFKNGTGGNLQLALDALQSARHTHSFIGIDQEGRTCVLKTRGNNATHIILRGGRSGPNYYEENVEEAEELFEKAGLTPAVMVDCSHANSGKTSVRQERVLHSIMDQRRRGRSAIFGFMVESNLAPGKQKSDIPLGELEYGKSITDECVGWEKTEEMLSFAYSMLE